MTATRCRRCNRPLSVAASVAAGIGPRCARIEALETALAETTTRYGFTITQATTAREAFADKAVVLDLRRRLVLVNGTKGSTYHVTTGLRCECKAATYGRRCWHTLAALTALQLDAVA